MDNHSSACQISHNFFRALLLLRRKLKKAFKLIENYNNPLPASFRQSIPEGLIGKEVIMFTVIDGSEARFCALVLFK